MNMCDYIHCRSLRLNQLEKCQTGEFCSSSIADYMCKASGRYVVMSVRIPVLPQRILRCNPDRVDVLKRTDKRETLNQASCLRHERIHCADKTI